MIKINLLGSDSESNIEAKLLLVAFALVFVLSLGSATYFTSIRTHEVAQLTEEKGVLEKELAELAKETKLVRDLEQKKDLVKQKLAVIAKLKKSKIGPVRVLDDFNSALPSRVWVLGVAEDNSQLKITGRALGNQDVALFMKNLEKSDFFSNVELQETRQMYYDKHTGDVKATKPVEQLKGVAFSTQKGKKVVFGDEKQARGGKKGASARAETLRQRVDPSFPIKEFILQATVNYAGKLSISEEKPEQKDKKKA